MATRAVTVAAEVLEHDHGHWCTRCLLSTGIRAVLAVTTGATTRVITAWVCSECSATGSDITPDPDPRPCGT